MTGRAVDVGPMRGSVATDGARPAATRRDLVAAVGLLALLVLAVTARWAAIQGAVADPIAIGVGFGLALMAVAAIGRSSPLRRMPRADQPTLGDLGWSAVIGLAGGGALVAVALAGRAVAGAPVALPPLRGDLFAPWAFATILVASGEEAVLRGVLFGRLLRGAGIWPAILVTSLVFALMHVPFYGWRVVPLDLGVGIWFAGLRLWSGGIVAPSISHALADLATWWL